MPPGVGRRYVGLFESEQMAAEARDMVYILEGGEGSVNFPDAEVSELVVLCTRQLVVGLKVSHSLNLFRLCAYTFCSISQS